MRNSGRGARNEKLASRGARAHLFQAIVQILTLGGVVFGLADPPRVYAQQVNKNQAAAVEKEADEAEQARVTVDLGRFQIKDLRPTRNETTKVTFAMHLALASTVDQQTVEQIEFWKHRLRDQVIVALRVAETSDFLEPSLGRFRRSVLLRMNRVLKATLVSEVLLTEFTFTLN